MKNYEYVVAMVISGIPTPFALCQNIDSVRRTISDCASRDAANNAINDRSGRPVMNVSYIAYKIGGQMPAVVTVLADGTVPSVDIQIG